MRAHPWNVALSHTCTHIIIIKTVNNTYKTTTQCKLRRVLIIVIELEQKHTLYRASAFMCNTFCLLN